MKISIISDSHDNWANMKMAISESNNRSCETLLHAGDLIAPPGIPLLAEFKGNVKFVFGNNEAEKLGLMGKASQFNNIEICGDIYEGEIGGVKIFMNHYPRIAELAAKSGDYDLCIFGHTHELFQQKIENTILVNPGEVQGYLSGKATFMIFDTNSREIEQIQL
jgi:putative phosphoesterase